MGEYFHSVTLDTDKCMGCINCIKRCPTEAIRVREDKASIIPERCIDCGECIRICGHHAKKAIYDDFSILQNYKYTVALVAPSFYGQFNNLEDTETVLGALKDIGFDAVFDVSKAAELVSEATRMLMETGSLPTPVISSACPAVLRMIRVRFPTLIENVLPLVAPVELAARMAKDDAGALGFGRTDVGCIFITPCPAKVTAIHNPLGSKKSEIDGALAVKDVYPLLLHAMKKAPWPGEKAQSGRIGISWAESGGEAASLLTTDSYLAADGIENVIKVLEDLERQKYPHLEFVELNACAGGCVGGVLQVENPYIAKAKLKRLRRYMPVSLNHLQGSLPKQLLWDADLEYNPAMELGATTTDSFEKYVQREEILAQLPALDCGSCGAPTCETFAEDVVRGKANINDCVVLMRRRMEAVLKAIGLDKEQ